MLSRLYEFAKSVNIQPLQKASDIGFTLLMYTFIDISLTNHELGNRTVGKYCKLLSVVNPAKKHVHVCKSENMNASPA